MTSAGALAVSLPSLTTIVPPRSQSTISPATLLRASVSTVALHGDLLAADHVVVLVAQDGPPGPAGGLENERRAGRQLGTGGRRELRLLLLGLVPAFDREAPAQRRLLRAEQIELGLAEAQRLGDDRLVGPAGADEHRHAGRQPDRLELADLVAGVDGDHGD